MSLPTSSQSLPFSSQIQPSPRRLGGRLPSTLFAAATATATAVISHLSKLGDFS
ncbi:hypothetical protein TIFTF001_003483 [Ficus carica]|uniref:Uncharacterized protein n=1 Tax=Ficus carica TaxID=3494 RepID=A0AA87ZHL5_FICCA|nr:hypothetical protein TIFTF001_003483 [Ficus carica]